MCMITSYLILTYKFTKFHNSERASKPGISRASPGHLPGISRASPEHLPGITRASLGHLPDISRASPGHHLFDARSALWNLSRIQL